MTEIEAQIKIKEAELKYAQDLNNIAKEKKERELIHEKLDLILEYLRIMAENKK